MLALIDRLVASERERTLARKWADFAFRRFGDEAVDYLQRSLTGKVAVKSKRALRMAVRRARANAQTRIFIASSR